MDRVETIGRATRIYALCEYPSWEPRYIGIEREPKYFDIACKRIEDAQRQGDFFV